MGLDATKPFFGVSDKANLKPVSSATKTIYTNETSAMPFKNIFDFTTAGDWDCVAAVERLPALHYSVDFIFLSFGIMGFNVEV